MGRKRRGPRRATVQVTRLDVAVGQSMVLPAPAMTGRAPAHAPSPEGPASPEGTAAPARGAEEIDASATASRKRTGPPRGILPDKASEDLDAAWGGPTGGSERDDWLKEQRPPHWD